MGGGTGLALPAVVCEKFSNAAAASTTAAESSSAGGEVACAGDAAFVAVGEDTASWGSLIELPVGEATFA